MYLFIKIYLLQINLLFTINRPQLLTLGQYNKVMKNLGQRTWKIIILFYYDYIIIILNKN